AVALHVNAIEPRSDRVADRSGDAPLEAAQVVVADIDLTAGFRREARLGGDDRDQAGRRVAAEERSLRAAQDFDPVERPELGQADACARTIDAVDEHADRAFEAGIVADGADAAD